MQTDPTLSANNSQHCCVFLHTCYMLLGVVVQSLKPVKLADGHNVQTDTTIPNIVGPTTLGVVASICTLT